MRTFLIALLGIIFCANLFASEAGEGYIPHTGSVQINGNLVKVSFYITEDNSLSFVQTEGISGSTHTVTTAGLGITLHLPIKMAEADVVLITKGIRDVLHAEYGDLADALNVQTRIRSSESWSPPPYQYLSGEHLVFFKPEYTSNRITALIKNAHMLPSGKMYTIVFDLPEAMPQGASLGLSFDDYRDRSVYSESTTIVVKNYATALSELLTDLSNNKFVRIFTGAYEQYDDIKTIVDMARGGIKKAGHNVRLLAKKNIASAFVELTIRDIKRLNDLKYTKDSGFKIASISNDHSQTDFCWAGSKRDDDITCNELQETINANNGGQLPNPSDPPISVESATQDTPTFNGPNANIRDVEVTIKGEDDYHNTLTVNPDAALYIRASVNNKGDVKYDEPEVSFFLDGGKRNLDCDKDDHVGKDEIDDLDPGDKHKEGKNVNAPSDPGTYWIYACIDSDVSDDTDPKNNRSKDSNRDEWVKLIVVDSSQESEIPLISEPEAPPINHTPTGTVETLSCKTASGWMKDEDQINGNSSIHVYTSNIDGSEKILSASINANEYHTDPDGNYGWTWTIPKSLNDGKEKKYYFYAINQPQGDNPLLSSNVSDSQRCGPCPGITYKRCMAAMFILKQLL